MNRKQPKTDPIVAVLEQLPHETIMTIELFSTDGADLHALIGRPGAACWYMALRRLASARRRQLQGLPSGESMLKLANDLARRRDELTEQERAAMAAGMLAEEQRVPSKHPEAKLFAEVLRLHLVPSSDNTVMQA